MSDPKSRTIPDAFTMYFVMLVIYCIDIFFFKSDLTVLGDAFYSRFLSLIVLCIYLWTKKISYSILGISKKKDKFITGAVYGTVFSVIPIAAVMAVECIIYGFTDITALDLRFSPPSLSHVHDIANLTPAIAVIIYTFTSFFGSVFKEFFFRGFMLKKLKSATKFTTANLVQALLYMSFTIPMLLRNLINHYYDNTTSSLGLFIVMFYIVHETLAGYKWGLLTRVTGCTYVAIIDHFLYVFLSNSVYITNRYVTWSFMLHMLAIQIVSTAMVAIYYKINMKKLEEKEKAEADAKDRKHSENKNDAEKKKLVKEKIEKINEISPEQYKNIVSQTEKSDGGHHHSSGGSHHRSGHHSHGKATLENLPASEANEIAEKFIEETLNSSEHHHHHHHGADGTEMSKNAVSENSAEADNSSEAAIDDFLRNFNNEESYHHHHHHSGTSYSDYEDNDNSTEISENFDADAFLKSYQSSHGHHHSSPSEHHHHSTSYRFNEEDDRAFVSAFSENNNSEKDGASPSEENDSGKQGFFDKIKQLGLVDDSDSNDLL